MKYKHNEQKEELFSNRVEDRLDSKGTKANPKFVYLRCVVNNSWRDGIGWPAKRIAGSTPAGERWSRVGGTGEWWREVGGAAEWHCKPYLWRRVGETVGHDGTRDAILANGGAGWGEPTNGAMNQIYCGEWVEWQRWIG